MNQIKIKLLFVTALSILFGALTIAVVFFVSTQKAPTAPESRPKAAGGLCYLEFFFPFPTPTPTVTPIPHACGSTPCDTSNNPCESGLNCVQNDNNDQWYCSLPAYQETCQTTSSPGFSTCCQAPPTSTPTPTATLTVTPTSTPGPSSTPTPTSTPNPSGTPYPTSTPYPTQTPAPAPCGSTCSSSTPCSSGLICLTTESGSQVCSMSQYQSTCRTNPSYATCCQAPATAAPTIVILQEAGVSFPTWTILIASLFLILLGFMFFAL